MGLDYSYEIWVPRAQLFDALSVVARHECNGEFGRLIWPDGRQLSGDATRTLGEDRIPCDGSLSEDFCLSFPFEADEWVLRYQEQMDIARGDAPATREVRHSNGSIDIGCIWTDIGLEIRYLNWLDGEAILTPISFTAATTIMSRLFEQSASVRRFFVELGRAMGAVSCALDKENSGCEWLYLDGEEIRMEAEFLAHPRWMRARRDGEEAAAERKLSACGAMSRGACSAHEKMELALLTRDLDSGLRAQSLSILCYVDLPLSLPLVDSATRDMDWRVRATAAFLIGRYEIESGIPWLEKLQDDGELEVRIAAVKALGKFNSTFEILRAIMLQTSPTDGDLGMIYAALCEIAQTTYQPHVISTLQTALALPNSPFPATAKERLARFLR